jgi:quinol monooxygenase YgiN
VIVVSRFDVDEVEDFLPQARAALDALAARPGFRKGRVGRAADDPRTWVLVTEWEGVGAYRRSLSAYDVKVHAAPLLSRARDEVSAFEVLCAVDAEGPATVAPSSRARDADTAPTGSGPEQPV